jgi:hypothetical protein
MTDRFDAQLREIASAMGDGAPEAPSEVPSTRLVATPAGSSVNVLRGTRVAVGVGLAMLLVVGGMQLISPRPESVGSEPPPPASTEAPPTTGLPVQAPVSEVASTAVSAPPPQVEALLEDPPHLLLEADGWKMSRYHEESYQPYGLEAPLVFRPAGADFGSATFVAAIFETTGWSAGEGAERIELDGRTVSIMADFILPIGHAAGVEFDDGTLIFVQGFGMDRTSFVDAARQVTLTTAGDPIVVPPPGYEQVVLPAPHDEIVTYRESQYEGPGAANAEVRIWSGTLADVELQVLNRAMEAQSVRPATIDGAAAAVAYHANNLSRVFVVGGDDGYVIEIDFNPFVDSATDADLDTILSQIRRVDLATFEAALTEGSVTSATVDAVVTEMLADIPLPAGFDPSHLGTTGDRYQVGAQVAGAVACAWIDQWVDATAAGDTEQAAVAADALATSHDWSVLLEMQDQGAYPKVLWEYADGVAGDGTVVGGRVLTVQESYQDALGCQDG